MKRRFKETGIKEIDEFFADLEYEMYLRELEWDSLQAQFEEELNAE